MCLLSEILTSRSRALIFRELFGLRNQATYLRELARRTGLACTTIRTELKRLVRLDLVEKTLDGNRTYYKARRNHPVYREIHQLVIKTNGLFDVLLDRLINANIDVAFVFGSIAKGTERSSSDIDLMVIGKVSPRELSRRLSGADDLLFRVINPIVMQPREFKKRIRAKEHFFNSLLTTEKVFIIGNEDDLRAIV